MRYFYITSFIAVTLLVLAGGLQTVRGAEVDELRDKIDQAEEQINSLNAEIAQLERDLQKVGANRSTLEAAIRELNLTRQKLLSDISLTQKKIEKAGYNIEQLGLAIGDKEAKIERNNAILAGALRTVKEADDQSLIETVLAYDSLSELWIELDQLETVQELVRNQLIELRGLKSELETQEAEERKEHENLSVFKSKLNGQKLVIEENKKEKDSLLSTTKSTEAQYQALLAQKRLSRQQMESALQEFESQLEYALDPTRLPTKGTGALGWPLESPTITQGFGLTDFARSGAYGYDKSGSPNPHRGIDFRASVGTPVLAAAPGTVRDAIDMDKTPGCYSYGKWILIDHDNGLSSLYAHLSVMSVSAGGYVKQGQIIGYAGATGYATGPHLHFTVFDREAVQVAPFSWSNGCKNTKIAYAPYEAYLNPLSYLPQ
ncbi:MAG TPA: peptidoglycan DD-metalloendopeptidase family protein [Candidatus Paceibacterota bacterium]|nr:peptidoglycan DD-metalloendopeptidase family protein [Candidatus Paceibacterota bacterium]